MKLEGKVALITGAGSGLGRQAAQLFTAEGAKVAIVDIDADRAEQTLKLVEQRGGDAIAITADVAVKDQITAAVDAAVDHSASSTCVGQRGDRVSWWRRGPRS